MASTTSAFNQRKDLIKLYRQALRKGIPLIKIEEKADKLAERFNVADKQETAEIAYRNKHFRQAIPKALRLGAAILPTLLLLLGVGLVGSATLPIVAYYVDDFSENVTELKAPLPPEQLLEVAPLTIASTSLAEGEEFGTAVVNDTGPVILNSALDYTDLSNWFAGSELAQIASPQSAVTYTVEIPKLNISQAQVINGGTDLNRSLIQYPGTALPGQPGAPVIFGHSVLRQFYNPQLTNPRRYNSIFSTIMTLEPGDKIYVTQDSVRYTYVVQSKTEVKPTDTYILSQNYSSRLLKLVTCVPEGTYLRRGVVTAQLIKE
ncbi:MAG TPA: sortase [Patescibacteria group bacterium]|jgi:LPXTG-site transpeptidase (sortase) family protein